MLILRRRLWTVYVIYLLLLALGGWFGSAGLEGLAPGDRVVGVIYTLLVATFPMLIAELVFVGSVRRRLRRLSDSMRRVEQKPEQAWAKGIDEFEVVWSDLRRSLRRFDETRGDLAVRRIRAEMDSRTDPLTGLYNHRSFVHSLGEAWNTAQQTRNGLSLLILDVDGFKSINDSLGHPAGNQVLIKVADLIRENVRETDLVFRYAGDEFAVIMPRTGLMQALSAGEKIRQRIGEERIEGIADRSHLGVTVGAAEMTEGMHLAEDLVQYADRALYHGKEAGRNVVAYTIGRSLFRVYKQERGMT